MLIGVPLETAAGESRVSVTPETAKKLNDLATTGRHNERHRRSSIGGNLPEAGPYED